jgi:hypothetical protein
MLAYIDSKYGPATTDEEVVAPPTGSDESSILGRFAYGAGTGFTDIPGGIASLFYSAEEAAKTAPGQFSEEARKYLQETFGIDPTKDPTAAQQAAQALGSVASFLVPGSAVAKGASLAGKTAAAAGRLGTVTAGAQGVALGAEGRAETIRNQIASGMEIGEEQQLAAQRLSGLIGASEALPIGRFFGPLQQLLSKVPVSQAPALNKIVQSRLGRITRAGAAEGAQEVASGIANDIMEYGIYNPDVKIGQDILSNAGTGAFAGSFVEGVIQLAAGRKLRPYRQLQEDLAKESAVNAQAQRQGEISRAAEELRQFNVEGDVEVVEDDFDGISRFTIRTPAGNTVGDFLDPVEAEEAIGIYKQRTDAKVVVRKPAELPSVFPAKINGKEYQTTDEVIADRDSLVAEAEGLASYMSRPDVIKREAARQNVSEAMIKKATEDEVAETTKKITKLNDFVATAKPFPARDELGEAIPKSRAFFLSRAGQPVITEAVVPEGTVPEAIVPEAAPEAITPEVVMPEAMAPEAPIGATEAVSSEGPITEAPAIVEAPEPVSLAQPEAPTIAEAPESSAPPVEGVPEEPRPLAGPLKEAPAPRRTFAQAEAEGPILRDYNQATIDRYAGIYTALKSRLSGKVPKDVDVRIEELIGTDRNLLIRGQARVEKVPNGIKSVVDLSTGILRPDMTVEQAVAELAETLNHEIIHVLRDQGVIRPAEWKILSRAAVKTKVPGRSYTYLDKAQTIYTPGGQPISELYTDPDAVIEEAVAEMYKDWVKNKNAAELGKNADGKNSRGLFNRITEFFRSIFRVLKSSKYQEVFKGIETGEVGAREGVGREAATRFAAAPALDSEEFKRWFKNSKAVNPDGSPLVVYHGTPGAAINVFETGKKGVTSVLGIPIEVERAGFYFSEKKGFAEGFARQDRGMGGGVTMPVYLSIQNPLNVTKNDNKSVERLREVAELMAKIDPSITGVDYIAGKAGYDDFWELLDKEEGGDVLIEAASQLGYDGIKMIEQDMATFDPDYIPDDEGAVTWVAFKPAQIKSVNNKGTFDPENPDIRYSAAPLPPYIEAKNRTLFVPEKKESIVQSIFDFFSAPETQAKTLNTVYGQIDMKGGYFGTRAAINRRMALVDQDAYVEWLEKTANEKDTGNFQRREANQSAIVALGMARRRSQLTASSVMLGAPTIEFTRPGDIQSATVAVRDDADKLIDIFRVMLQPGPVDPATNEPRDKRTIFKTYATAMRAIGLKAAGRPVPRELDDTYINTTIQFTQQNYPEIVEAYKSYQRFNKKLLTAARDAGRITNAELAKFTQQMDYYGFNREIYEEQLLPGAPSRLAGDIKIREYKGSQDGKLIEDPMLVILSNVDFWMGAITHNIAVNKAFKLAKDMGEARLLGASEKPDLSRGESEQVMFFRENGVLKRFAVKDPMLVTSLGSDDRIDMGRAMSLMGMPTSAIRETITRDPAFMVANLLRDTLSSWITSGENITPFIGTIKGAASALKGSASFQALMGRGVVGSHDLAMRSPAEMAAIIRRRAMPKNILNIGGPGGAQNMVMSLWDKLGVLSEASDAATRIAVYEAAIKDGMSEAEAAFRAIEIMNFSRRGSSGLLKILTQLIPFLNARIQGMDVLYQAGKAGILTAGGYRLGERDANLGKKFLVRGAMLAGISLALEFMLEDDEDYRELPDYVKNSNLLIPLKWFGVEGGYFAAIPNPFEAGLLFSTIPRELYKAAKGETSAREGAKFFWEELVSTFGLNPIPQIASPIAEIYFNMDMYTGLPLISEGKMRLTPELQYDSRTSTVARMLGDIPISYNFTTGKFEGVSPIVIDQLVSGYGGPFGSYIMQGVGMLMEEAGAGPERLPRDITQLPMIKRFLLDAESRSPKSVAQAYELFRVVDEVNRSFSRLRQTGDTEAVMDYLAENKDVLSYKKYIYKLFDGLNKISARERQIERDETMTRDEKFEAMRKLREVRARLTSQISEINKKLGR